MGQLLFITMDSTKIKTFKSFNFYLILYTILVIVWGAWVRISHSGDGCGASWPLCHDEFIPVAATEGKTWVEYLHRVTSGIYGIIIFVQFFWGRKLFAKAHPVQFWLWMSLIFTITEALLGAKLVLFELVGDNQSIFRVIAMTLHLVNSMILTAAIASVWYFSEHSFVKTPMKFKLVNISQRVLILSFVVPFLVVGATGAWAALASTLYPSESFIASLMKELAPDSHFLMSLRTFHPVFGTILGAGLILLLIVLKSEKTSAQIEKYQKQLRFLILAQIFVGYLTLFLVSPIKLKFIHLILAHGSWIVLILWLHSLRYQAPRSDIKSPDKI